MSAPNRLARLPPYVSRWLGYRSGPLPKRADYIVYLWSFIGAFAGISVIQAVFEQAHYFVERNVPSIIASYVSRCSFALRGPRDPELTTCTGSLGCADLWCRRRTARAAAHAGVGTLHRGAHWRMHHQALPPSPDGGTFPEPRLARGVAVVRVICCRHADHRHHASTCR